jgi:hypothetical protein
MKNNLLITTTLLMSFLGMSWLPSAGKLKAQDPVLETHWWGTNGNVRTMVKDQVNAVVYIGGNFTGIIPDAPNGAPVDVVTGKLFNSNFAKPNGTVRAAAPDGSGGWYIGGEFTEVSGISRSRLAHINAAGEVTSWNPDADNIVHTIDTDGTLVYVGGTFLNVGGEPRNRLASIDAGTGAVTAWNPNANNIVFSIAVSGNTVYVGGQFTTMGADTRNRIAAFDAATGEIKTWNPGVSSGIVRAVAVSGNIVYIGFSVSATVGGQTRSRIAAIDATTGSVTSWNPNVGNNQVFTIATDGTTVYLGGNFTTVGGQTRNRVAAANAATGAVTSWNPNATSGIVYSLAINGSTIYVSGSFTNIGGEARERVAAIDAATGLATTWNSVTVGLAVWKVSFDGNSLFVGGTFTATGGQLRNYLAAFNGSTGDLLPWNPNADNSVQALEFDGSTVYVAGTFQNIGGAARNRVAAINGTTGLATSWNPNAGSAVYALALDGSIIYIGGAFTNIGGQPRNRIAAIDVETGTPTSWNPDADSEVYTLVPDGNIVYTGGLFTTIGGQPRNRIAAIDASTGAVTSWNPDASNQVNAMKLSGNTVYVGGSFNTIGGSSRPALAALDAATGLLTSWDPSASGSVFSMALNGSTVYVGGNFINIGGQARNRIAAIDINTGAATDWNPDMDNNVFAVASYGNTIYTGGIFTVVGGQNRNCLAVFSFPSTEIIWTGITSNDWNTPANWDGNLVPTVNDNVVIPDVSGGSGYFPQISGSAVCNDLLIETGAFLTISSDGALTVEGSATNNGNLSIQSDASGSGSLIENSGVQASTERYFTGNTIDWHLVSSPVSNATANVFYGMYLQNFNETTNSYTDVTLSETPLNVLEGYALYSTLSAVNTITFNGSLNTGTQTKGYSADNSGWNLLGNPFASSIDWETVSIPSGLSNEVHYIEASTGNDLSYVQGVGGTGSQYIAPAQGFFVKATSAGTFSLGSDQRTHSGANNFYKSYNPHLMVLEASGANYSDQTWIHINGQAGVEHDGIFDAYKRISESNPELPQIFSYTPAGDRLAVNGMPEAMTVPVGFTAVETGSFTITAIEKGDFANLYLEDLLTGTLTNLMINSFTFDFNSGDQEHRFNLHFNSLATSEVSDVNHNIFSRGNKIYIESVGNNELVLVYHVTGQLIASTRLNNGMNEIAVEKTGNYIVKVISSTSFSTKKVFIK